MFYNREGDVVCRSVGGITYDKNGNVVSNYQVEQFALNGNNNMYLTYKLGLAQGQGLVAINSIPQPPDYVNGSCISLTSGDPLVTVDGQTRTIEDNNYFFSPVMQNDRMLLPYGLWSAIGIDANYDEDSQTVTASRDGKTVTLPIGSNDVDVDGETVTLDVAAQAVDGRVLVPFEEVAEILGASYDWNGDTNTLTLFFE